MNKFIDRRFILALLIAAILIASQPFFRYESMGGVECLKSLTDPNAARQVTGFSTSYGFPLSFLTTSTNGCFEQQITHYNLEPIGLLVNVLFIGILATVPYWLQAIRGRLVGGRQNKSTKTL